MREHYNSKKTHCKRGHALDAENTYWTKAGKRLCKPCQKIHSREYAEAAGKRYFTRRRAYRNTHQDIADIINENIVVVPSGCWIWTGAAYSTRGGYGRFLMSGKSTAAHRASYEVHVGPIPDGLVIDHLCRTPLCVNWRHLEPVTARENILRGNGMGARWARRTAEQKEVY